MAKVKPIEFRPSKYSVYLEPADPSYQHKYSVLVRVSPNSFVSCHVVSTTTGEIVWQKVLHIHKEIARETRHSRRTLAYVYGLWKLFQKDVHVWLITGVYAAGYLYHFTVYSTAEDSHSRVSRVDNSFLWRTKNLVVGAISHTRIVYTDTNLLPQKSQLYVMYIRDGLVTLENSEVRVAPLVWNTPYVVSIEEDTKKHPLMTKLPRVQHATVKASHPLLITRFSQEEKKDDSQLRL